ncbi:Tat pathway signal sequence domain protein [Streptomyces sp. NPDC057638]|uniref:Tat pathway signal sequence domain protein n=1 Tax=Streptomyces sp. NPDC057638 TaxID=3346190 RepID=UPI0036A3EBD6
MIAMTALALGSAYLYLTRPIPAAPPPTPFPAQSVAFAYDGPAAARGAAFGFRVQVSAVTGPPVTVERITQVSEALRVSTEPAAPFTVRTERPRTVLVMIDVSDCGKVPRNAGLPFLDVTLRNTRAIQEQSFILGEEYARDLARALGSRCPQDQLSAAKPPYGPARSHHADATKRMEFGCSTHGVPLCITHRHNKSVTAWPRPLHQRYSPP